MKVVLSRKGFDSGYGGYPSLIMPENRLLSLPIPWHEEKICYSDLYYNNSLSVFDIMKQINSKIKADGKREVLTTSTKCHLDPDLTSGIYPRKKGWKPIFGQASQAQGHLEKQGIGCGDLFLFFGLFRRVVITEAGFQFDKKLKPVQLIYGYLQIGEIVKTKQNENIPDWMRYHPHMLPSSSERETNTIYVASDTFSLNPGLPGGGVLNYSEKLILTKEGHSPSRWDMPQYFKEVEISYHGKNSKYGWQDDYFQSARKGQEFVIDDHPKIVTWAADLINNNSSVE